MWLIGWTCDWAGPDNFLDTAFFNYQGGKPSPEFAYTNDRLSTTTMKAAEAATDDATAKSLWEKAQDLIRADLPDGADRQLDPASRREGLREGLRRLGQPDRDLQHGLARQVT